MSEQAPRSRPTLLWCGPPSVRDRVESLLADLDIELTGCTDACDLPRLVASSEAAGALVHAVAIESDADDWERAVAALESSGIPWMVLAPDDAPRPEVLEAGAAAGAHGLVAAADLESVLPVWLGPLVELAASRSELASLRRTIEWQGQFQQLSACLEAGQLHPLGLDLLMRSCGREQGLALFHPEGPGKGLASAFRGFDEEQSDRLQACLVDDKPLDLESLEGIGVVDRGPVHEALREAGVAADEILQVPVEGQAGTTGVLYVPSGGVPIGEVELSAAALLLEHVRMAQTNVEKYLKAKERAFVDDVTELYNARYLIQTADNEIQRADRYGNPLSVLFLDLDRFKRVNDEWGHLVGSETLRRLARLLSGCVRQVDTLARYGGDEFTILLVDTDHNAAVHVAERIRRTVEEETFEVGPEARLKLTVSVGVATCPDHATTREALLDTSDKAMYRAKSDGRNRVCSAHELFDD